MKMSFSSQNRALEGIKKISLSSLKVALLVSIGLHGILLGLFFYFSFQTTPSKVIVGLSSDFRMHLVIGDIAKKEFNAKRASLAKNHPT